MSGDSKSEEKLVRAIKIVQLYVGISKLFNFLKQFCCFFATGRF